MLRDDPLLSSTGRAQGLPRLGLRFTSRTRLECTMPDQAPLPDSADEANRPQAPPSAPKPAAPPGSRLVHCAKLGRDLPGLPAAPFPTALGQRIHASISQEAWRQWVQHSQMLINERGLQLSDPKARQALLQECEAFLFGPGAAPPPGWVPPAGSVRLKKKS